MRIDVRTRLIAGGRRRVRDYLPPSPADVPPLVWVHGGGFAGGSIDMPESDAVARFLAERGQLVRTVDYRLAPDLPEAGPLAGAGEVHRYPAAQDDVLDAFTQLAPEGKAFLGGASAGACIAASAAMRLREELRPMPCGLVLAYGLFHARFPVHSDTEGITLRKRIDVESANWLSRMTLNYAGHPDRLTDPLIFPGEGDPRGLPATLILDAEHDSLRTSGKQFAQQLRDAQVRVEEDVIAGAEHGFLNEPDASFFFRGVAIMREWMLRSGSGA